MLKLIKSGQVKRECHLNSLGLPMRDPWRKGRIALEE